MQALNKAELLNPSRPGQRNSDRVLIIQPCQGWTSLGLRDLWEYRELLFLLTWRELQGTYRQTALGAACWIFLRPVVNVLVLSLVFGYVVKVPSDGIPYPLFSLAALLSWNFFSNAVQRGARSLLDNIQIVSKVYFPRLVFPIACALSSLSDFAASFVVFLVLLGIYRQPLRWAFLAIPFFLFLAFLFSLSVGLWFSAMSVKYRDAAFAVTFFLQAFMYMSPVVYPVSIVPRPLLWLYRLNPMTCVIEGFRWALLGSGSLAGISILIPVALVLAMLISGALFFRRAERSAVDFL